VGDGGDIHAAARNLLSLIGLSYDRSL